MTESSKNNNGGLMSEEKNMSEMQRFIGRRSCEEGSCRVERQDEINVFNSSFRLQPHREDDESD